MRFFNAAMNMAIKAKAKARKDYHFFTNMGVECDYEKLYNGAIADQMDTFDKALQICEQMQQRVPASCNAFVVTVAPRHDVEFVDFFTISQKFARSSMFVAYAYAFEQKGTNLDTIGEHAHCHFVIATTYSKSHVLRRVRELFGQMCGESGMQVDKSKTPENFLQKYLIEHVGREDSEDAKSLTTSTDALWREQMNLLPLYTSENASTMWNLSVDVTKSNNIDS